MRFETTTIALAVPPAWDRADREPRQNRCRGKTLLQIDVDA